jgi:lipopolysaccharide transport system ATP-binding protein
MSNPVIKVESLSKKYIIGHQRQEHSASLRDIFTQGARNFSRKILSPFSRTETGGQAATTEEFYALKDVSFEIEQGDRLGIIGPNGAGKSTLLKILGRITEPTSGRVSIKGRIASLLEVGTGFHPELTGRENIYLNGAILGMTRAEIKRKFDEIVAFSEVERFLDTPVKHYSSGMYVRLAFSVAAHLEPETLIVDEVLAVGDAKFQQKCLGKMDEVSQKEGRTVLFVSHQTGMILSLCNKALLLRKGEIEMAGTAPGVVTHYMNQITTSAPSFEAAFSKDRDISIIKAEAFSEEGKPETVFKHTQPITIAITCKINKWVNEAEIRLGVRDSRRNVFTTDNEFNVKPEGGSDTVLARVTIPGETLRAGRYFFSLMVFVRKIGGIDSVKDSFSVTVMDAGSKWATEDKDYGCVFVNCSWELAGS